MPDAERFRLEPVITDTSLLTGLRMQVADPAWMLARQRQFGELTAEDVGSPAAAKLWTLASPLTRFQPKPPDGTPGEEFDSTVPFEALTENEWQPRDESSAQFAALAGRHYLRLLAGDALADYRAELIERFPLAVLGGPTTPLLALAPGRVPDGQAVWAALVAAGPQLPTDPPIPPGQEPAVQSAGRSFLAWCRGVTARDVTESSAWVPERLEYQLSIAGPTASGELVFEAPSYDSGRLDWYDFDVVRGATLGAAGDPGVKSPKVQTFLPTPATFRGMPSPRLWELEDASVDLGAQSPNPEDLATLLLIEFAVRYGNDFFLVPLPLEVGEISRVGALVVSDTFGERFLIDAASAVDGGLRLFEHSTNDASRELGMVTFPATVGLLESTPIEEVAMVRDEVANLCWAIERTAVTASGLPVDRGADLAERRPPPLPAGRGSLPHYRIRTPLTGNWYPLLPAEDEPSALVIGDVRPLPGDEPQERPTGRVLNDIQRTPIPAEEVTRDGHRIVRVVCYARGSDGAQVLWVGRRAGSTPSTGSSGLEYDTLER